MRNDLVGRPMEVLLVEDNRMDAHFAIRAWRKRISNTAACWW